MEELSSDPVVRMTQAKHEFGEYGGVNHSIEISTTFTVMKPDLLPAIFAGERGPDKGGCYVYGRSFNPTVRVLGRQLAALEATEAAYTCSSGMAAVSSALLALCNSGDHIVASNTVYGGSFALFKSFLPVKCGINVTFVDITDLEAVAAAFTPRTKVLYTETISNPTLVVADLPRLSALAHERGAQLVVDNTFAPLIITPAKWGADVVVHSLTKFVSGASDIVAGAVCGSSAFIASLMDFHTGPMMLLGPTMDPKVASELLLRLPHLPHRITEHSRRALYLSEQLQALGAKVVYPGLPSHPQHALLSSIANPGYGFGGLMGVDLGTKLRAGVFMERLQNKHGFGFIAVSLGYFDTLMSLSAASTSSELDEADRAASGIADGYVRMSIGITGGLDQRWHQLQEAFTFVSRVGEQVPYRAVKVHRDADGQLTELMSWPSEGSDATDHAVGGDGSGDASASEDDGDSGDNAGSGSDGAEGPWVEQQVVGLPTDSHPAAAAAAAAGSLESGEKLRAQPAAHRAKRARHSSSGAAVEAPVAVAPAPDASAGVGAVAGAGVGKVVKVKAVNEAVHIVYRSVA